MAARPRHAPRDSGASGADEKCKCDSSDCDLEGSKGKTSVNSYLKVLFGIATVVLLLLLPGYIASDAEGAVDSHWYAPREAGSDSRSLRGASGRSDHPRNNGGDGAGQATRGHTGQHHPHSEQGDEAEADHRAEMPNRADDHHIEDAGEVSDEDLSPAELEALRAEIEAVQEAEGLDFELGDQFNVDQHYADEEAEEHWADVEEEEDGPEEDEQNEYQVGETHGDDPEDGHVQDEVLPEESMVEHGEEEAEQAHDADRDADGLDQHHDEGSHDEHEGHDGKKKHDAEDRVGVAEESQKDHDNEHHDEDKHEEDSQNGGDASHEPHEETKGGVAARSDSKSVDAVKEPQKTEDSAAAASGSAPEGAKAGKQAAAKAEAADINA